MRSGVERGYQFIRRLSYGGVRGRRFRELLADSRRLHRAGALRLELIREAREGRHDVIKLADIRCHNAAYWSHVSRCPSELCPTRSVPPLACEKLGVADADDQHSELGVMALEERRYARYLHQLPA